ncbi:hypothetical protein DL96DRAFT_452577 [Flagelloscypha sp. PMI_526]|nr:hypothetical protein DL96DRAFT_452577 [Flagelloscypha sp. PMI_526]
MTYRAEIGIIQMKHPTPVPIHNRVLPDWWKSDYKPTTPPKVPFKIVHRVSNNDSLSSKQLEWERLGHRAPKPIWASLEANTPTSVQQIPGFGWPANVPTATYQWHIERYLRSFASWLGVNVGDKNPDVSYSTRVESVEKRYNEAGKHHGWTLLLRKFVKTDEKTYEESWWTEDFDAVAVATGRFQVPSIPLIPGLVDWQARFPDQIQHTRQYRRPETYANKNVLVVGAGPSSTEIARDVNMSVKRCYLSLRPSNGQTNFYSPMSVLLKFLQTSVVPFL